MKKKEWRKRRRRLCVTMVLLLVVACLFCAPASAETRQYLLGDIDDFFYNGAGSVDDVYIDPAWLAWAEESRWGASVPFDSSRTNQDQGVLFTFAYALGAGESVTEASLTLGLRSTRPAGDPDWWGGFWALSGSVRPSFYDLYWYPISDVQTTICWVDLSDVHGYNLMHILQTGMFSAAVGGSVGVDYAILTLEVVPEPATVLLLASGILLRRRSNR